MALLLLKLSKSITDDRGKYSFTLYKLMIDHQTGKTATPTDLQCCDVEISTIYLEFNMAAPMYGA